MSSLFKDKYFPKKFDDFLVHKDDVPKFKSYSNNYLMNTIIYGPLGSGKYTLAINMIKNYIDHDIFKKKITKFTIRNNSNLKEINIIQSQYHFEINVNNYLLNDSVTIIKLLQQLVESKNIISDKFKVILIRNIEYLNPSILKYFCLLTEKYVENIRLILITNNSCLTKKLNSYFSCIKLSLPKVEDIENLIDFVSKDQDLNINIKNKQNIISKCERNLNKIMINLENVKISGKYVDYKNYIDLEINVLIKYLKKDDVKSCIKIREIIYSFITKNYSVNYLIKCILKKLLSLNISNDLKQNIIRCACTYQQKIQNSYKSLIHFEAFIFNIKYLIS